MTRGRGNGGPDRLRVCVLTGGASAERDVALASAAQVVTALRARGHLVQVADVAGGPIAQADEPAILHGRVEDTPPSTTTLDAAERAFLLRDLRGAVGDADVLFLALHGGRGEDGTVQAVLDVLGLPYTGSGALGSAVAMDKHLSKQIFRLAGVPTPAWALAPITAEDAGDRFGWPVIVKPSRQGSTVGLTLVKEPEAFDAALAHAARFDDDVLVESFLPGRELTIGVLEDAPLSVGEIVPVHEIFDYECKYQPGMAEEIFPAELDEAVAHECGRLAVAAHRALRLGGYSRVDFCLTAEGDPSCLEVNTLPGLTAASLLPKSAAASGIPFEELCERICRSAISRGIR